MLAGVRFVVVLMGLNSQHIVLTQVKPTDTLMLCAGDRKMIFSFHTCTPTASSSGSSRLLLRIFSGVMMWIHCDGFEVQ